MKNVESAGIIAAVTIISLIVIGWQIYDYSQNLGQIKYAIYEDVKYNVVRQTYHYINSTIDLLNKGSNDLAVFLLDKAICLMDTRQYKISMNLGQDYIALHSSLDDRFDISDKLYQISSNIVSGNLTQGDIDYLQRCEAFYKYLYDRMVEPIGDQYRINDLSGILVSLGKL